MKYFIDYHTLDIYQEATHAVADNCHHIDTVHTYISVQKYKKAVTDIKLK